MLGALNRNKVAPYWLFWMKGKNRTTGAVEQGGLWSGAMDRTFTIGGVARAYAGGGQIIGLDGMRYTSGTRNIQSQTVELNAVTPQVEALLRTYEPRQAEFEIHRVYPNNPSALSGTWTIEQAFVGRIDSISFPRDSGDLTGEGGELRCQVTLMSASRMGTRVLHLKKSDASQRLVDPNDAGRKYSSSKAKVQWMGEVDNPHKRRNSDIADPRLI